MKSISIDRPILENMWKNSSLQTITEGKIKEIIYYKNRPFIATASAHNQSEGGCIWVDAYLICPIAAYKGNSTPLLYKDHQYKVNVGLRKRGYPGMLCSYEGKDYVITDEKIVFTPLESGVQIKMF